MITVADGQLREMLRQVVAERPEYVYSPPEYMVKDVGDCFYVHEDEAGERVGAGCVIGVVLHRLGVPLGELEKHEGQTIVQMLNEVTRGASRSMAIKLGVLQFNQDEGMPWGEAYIKAMGESI
ncbi:hypothetical protein [Streptomyces sp. 4F14]|uniref:hypothetical protein n=1 Tax=Streptomyces sp. 4F14 TaxID=3394380 RepID=UPI003A885B71